MIHKHRNIPSGKQPVDGIISGNSRQRKRRGSFDEPFITRRKVGRAAQQPMRTGVPPTGQWQPVNQPSAAGSGKQKGTDKKQKKPGRARRWFKRILIILIIAVLVGGGYFVFKGYAKWRNIFRGGGSSAVVCGEVDPDELKVEGDGRVNILLLGVGGEEHQEGTNLSDSMMIMSINPLSNTVGLLSLPRDLWVSVNGTNMKINAAYQAGMFAHQDDYPSAKLSDWSTIQAGLKTVDTVVSDNLGIPINFNVVIDFKAFEQAIDAVGGVDINVPERLVDSTVAWENGWSSIIAEAGPQHMDSKQALLYVRSRHGSARGDFDRAERQRAMILALQKEVLSAGTLANPVKVSQLIDALGNNVRTDIGGEERTCLINIARQVDGSKATSVDLYSLVEGGNVRGQSVQMPKAGRSDYREVKSFVRNQLKDSYIARENAEIVVLNGTNDEGLAGKVADTLKSYGYNVSSVGDAPSSNYTTTEIVDVSTQDSPKYTLNYLQRRLGGKVTSSLPSGVQQGSAKIVILVGRDAASN